jgi:hypothetical protein
MSSDLLPFTNQGQYHAQTKETRLQAPNPGSWYHVSNTFEIQHQPTNKQATTRDPDPDPRCVSEKWYLQYR